MATPSQSSKRPASTAVNKKVAKAARAGGGPSKRSGKSDNFTLAVIGVIVAGIALVAGSVYGRRVLELAPYIGNQNQSTGAYESDKLESARQNLLKLQAAKKPDTKKIEAATKKLEALVSDTHWHSAYGIYNCDHWEPAIDATAFPDATGIHAHEDGLIHIHPFLQRAAGKNAKLGLFFDAMFMSMSKTQLKFPTGTAGVAEPTSKQYTTLKTSTGCKDKNGKKVAARVSVYKWDSPKDTTAEIYTEDFRSIPLVEDGAYAFVFAPTNAKVTIPASVSALANPVDVETSSTASTSESSATTTTVAGATTTTVAGATTTAVAGATTTTVAGATTTAVAGATTTAVAGATTTTAAAATTAAPTTAAPTTAAPTTTAAG